MPLRLDVKRLLSCRSERVKCCDLHPNQPWVLFSLYNGQLLLWNYETEQLVKTFEICDMPVRTARFVERKSWIVTGSDDMQIRIYNYNTMEKVDAFDAHTDYIRSIVIHPTQPYILSSSDDMTVKMWNWEKNWQCVQTFEGHSHYVMQIVINPKDNNTFATASLDKTVKVWQLGSSVPNFTLEGHEKGVNCIEYYPAADKPYLISGGDDAMVKIWDYQNKSCVQTLTGHARNISAVAFHPELPIALSGSEDGTVRIWHANTHRLESTLNYGMERVWSIACMKGSNTVAIGYDEGSIVIKLGREEPAVSMDVGGKIVWSKHTEIQQANLKALGPDTAVQDGERLAIQVKDMGSCEVYPQSLRHSPNGRFVAVCGDGEFIIYTAMALRNKSFGPAQEFVWAADSSQYAVRESSSAIKLFKNFKDRETLKPDLGCEAIFGGQLLGVRHSGCLSFYDWEGLMLVRRIEIQPKQVFWSENGELVAICTESSYYVLRYRANVFAAAQADPSRFTEDGVEDAFVALNEVAEVVKTGIWVGDCFIYTNAASRLNYYVGGEIVTISHVDRPLYLLGYIAKDNRVYLCDKDLNVVSYHLLRSVLEYQTVVMRGDLKQADKLLEQVPTDHRTRVAHFLDKQGFKQQALAVSTDPEHRFDLACQLSQTLAQGSGELKNVLQLAYDIAKQIASAQKWKQLANICVTKCDFQRAMECLMHAEDHTGLLLLASATGQRNIVERVALRARQQKIFNVAFLAYWMLQRVDDCLEILISSQRLPEAALFAHTYLPSQVSRVVQLWRRQAQKLGQEKLSQAIADPEKYDNLFGGERFQQALKAEQFFAVTERSSGDGAEAVGQKFGIRNVTERNLLAEMAVAESSGNWQYQPGMSVFGSRTSQQAQPRPLAAVVQNGLGSHSKDFATESASTLLGADDDEAEAYPVDTYSKSAAEVRTNKPAANLLDSSNENISAESSTRQQPSPNPHQPKGLVSSVLSSLGVAKKDEEKDVSVVRKTSDIGPNGTQQRLQPQQQRSAYDMGEIRNELSNLGGSTGSSSHSSYVKLDSNNGSSDAVLSQTSGSNSSYASAAARGGGDLTSTAAASGQATRNVPQANLLGDDDEDENDDEDDDDFTADFNRRSSPMPPTSTTTATRSNVSAVTRNAPPSNDDEEEEENESDEDLENENARHPVAARKLLETSSAANANKPSSSSSIRPAAPAQTANLLGEDDDDEWSRFD